VSEAFGFIPASPNAGFNAKNRAVLYFENLSFSYRASSTGNIIRRISFTNKIFGALLCVTAYYTKTYTSSSVTETGYFNKVELLPCNTESTLTNPKGIQIDYNSATGLYVYLSQISDYECAIYYTATSSGTKESPVVVIFYLQEV